MEEDVCFEITHLVTCENECHYMIDHFTLKGGTKDIEKPKRRRLDEDTGHGETIRCFYFYYPPKYY